MNNSCAVLWLLLVATTATATATETPTMDSAAPKEDCAVRVCLSQCEHHVKLTKKQNPFLQRDVC